MALNHLVYRMLSCKAYLICCSSKVTPVFCSRHVQFCLIQFNSHIICYGFWTYHRLIRFVYCGVVHYLIAGFTFIKSACDVSNVISFSTLLWTVWQVLIWCIAILWNSWQLVGCLIDIYICGLSSICVVRSVGQWTSFNLLYCVG